MVTFNVKTAVLLGTLKKMAVAVRRGPAEDYRVNCEITVKSELIELVVPGAFFTIKALTSGTAKISLPFIYFENLVRTHQLEEFNAMVTKNEMAIGNLTIGVKTTFFENDGILKRIDLPINYGIQELFKAEGKYTEEELEFNQLKPLIDQEKRKLSKAITRSYELLKIYGVKKDMIKDLVEKALEKTTGEI